MPCQTLVACLFDRYQRVANSRQHSVLVEVELSESGMRSRSCWLLQKPDVMAPAAPVGLSGRIQKWRIPSSKGVHARNYQPTRCTRDPPTPLPAAGWGRGGCLRSVISGLSMRRGRGGGGAGPWPAGPRILTAGAGGAGEGEVRRSGPGRPAGAAPQQPAALARRAVCLPPETSWGTAPPPSMRCTGPASGGGKGVPLGDAAPDMFLGSGLDRDGTTCQTQGWWVPENPLRPPKFVKWIPAAVACAQASVGQTRIVTTLLPPPPLQPPPTGGEPSLGPKSIATNRRQRKFYEAPKLIYTVILWYIFVVQSAPPPWGGTGLTKGGRLQGGGGTPINARLHRCTASAREHVGKATGGPGLAVTRQLVGRWWWTEAVSTVISVAWGV